MIQEIKDESTRIKGKKKNKDRMKRKFSKFVSTMKEAGINPRKALSTMVAFLPFIREHFFKFQIKITGNGRLIRGRSYSV